MFLNALRSSNDGTSIRFHNHQIHNGSLDISVAICYALHSRQPIRRGTSTITAEHGSGTINNIKHGNFDKIKKDLYYENTVTVARTASPATTKTISQNLLPRQIRNMNECIVKRRKNVRHAKYIFSFRHLWTESDLCLFFRSFGFSWSHAKITTIHYLNIRH